MLQAMIPIMLINNYGTNGTEKSSFAIPSSSLMRTHQQQYHQPLGGRGIINRRTKLDKLNGSFTFAFRDFVTPPSATEFSGRARFGYSSDFADLFGTASEQHSYIVGLVWLGVVVAIIFLIWFFVIIVLYMLGPKRAGFLSGSPLRNHPASSSNTQHESATSHKQQQQQQQQQHSTNELYDNDNSSANNGANESNLREPVSSIKNNVDGNHTAEDGDNLQNEQSQQDTMNPNTKSDLLINNNSQGPDGIMIEESNNNNKIDFRKEDNQPERFPNANENATRHHRQCCACFGIEQSRWVRGTFILSGVIVIVFSILLVTLGLSNLQQAVITINGAAYTSNNITTAASTLIETDALAVQQQAAPLIDDLNNALSNEVNCPNSTNATQADMVIQFLNATATAVAALQGIGQYIQSNDIGALLATLDSAKKMSHDIYDTTNRIDVTSWEALVVAILFTFIPFLLIISAVLSANKRTYPKFHCFMVWVIFPLFFILMVLTAIFCSVFIITASSNSDFCYPLQYRTDPNVLLPPGRQNVTMNSPDVSALQILQNLGYSINNVEYKIAAFYITQCFVSNPFSSLEGYAVDLEAAKENLSIMAASLNSTEVVAELTTVCGGSYNGVSTTIGQVQSFVVELSNYITDLVSLLQCDNIVPIYQESFYDAGCDASLKSMIWLFSSSLIVATFGFLMITLRAAYSRTLDDNTTPYVGSVRSNIVHEDVVYDDSPNVADVRPEYDARDNSTSFQDERNEVDPSEGPNEGTDNTSKQRYLE